MRLPSSHVALESESSLDSERLQRCFVQVSGFGTPPRLLCSRCHDGLKGREKLTSNRKQAAQRQNFEARFHFRQLLSNADAKEEENVVSVLECEYSAILEEEQRKNDQNQADARAILIRRSEDTQDERQRKKDLVLFVTRRDKIDPLSICLLICDVRLLYESLDDVILTPLEIQYDEFQSWLREQEEATREEAEPFWHETLCPPLPDLSLSIEEKSNSLQKSAQPEYSKCAVLLSDTLCDKIRNYSLERHISIEIVIFAAFAVTLCKYGLTSDLLIGYHDSGRGGHVEIANVIGRFETWLPMRVNFEDHPTVEDLLRRLSDNLVVSKRLAFVKKDFPAGFEFYGNAVDDYGFPLIATRLLRLVLGLTASIIPENDEDIVKGTKEEDESSSPSSSSSHAFGQGLRWRNAKPLTFGGVELYPIHVQKTTRDDGVLSTKDKIRLVGVQSPLLRLAIEFETTSFSRPAIERMAAHLGCILSDLVSSLPEKHSLHLRMIDSIEEDLVLRQFNMTEKVLRTKACIHEMFQQTAEKRPDAVAVSLHGGREFVTYGELEGKANQLARFLLLVGVNREEAVPVLMERSMNVIVSWLAILKAGASVMPMDARLPDSHIEEMIEEAAPKCVLTSSSFVDKFNSRKIRVIQVDKDWDGLISLGSTAKFPSETGLDKLAYVIYTSGSTGRPKGVMLEHSALTNYVNWHIDFYQMASEDRVFACAGLAFDASIADTWPTLAIGACILPVTNDIAVIPSRFLEWVIQERASMGFLTTQLCEMVLQEDRFHPRERLGDHLRLIYTGGDRLHFGARVDSPFELVNIYGPTENTVNSTMCFVPRGEIDPPSIGSPAPNTKCYILDPFSMNPQPVGVFGELHVAGAQLARGYFKMDELTREKFVANPFNEMQQNNRMYRTGDLARWQENGQIEFLGRRDTQVKIRGNRVELSAIENVILRHESVKEVAILAQADDSGNKQLTAFCVASDFQIGVDDAKEDEKFERILRGYVTEQLPDYMVPSHFKRLDNLPLTTNHKVDRRQLALVGQQRHSPTHSLMSFSPRESIRVPTHISTLEGLEEFVRVTMSSVLLKCPERVGNGNFFDLGGESLGAGRVTMKVSNMLGSEIPLSLLYKFSDVKSYCAACWARAGRGGEGESLSLEVTNCEMISYNEKSLWLIAQNPTSWASMAYNVSFSCQFDEKDGLNLLQLEKAQHRLMEKFEILRTTFHQDDRANSNLVRRFIHQRMDADFENMKEDPMPDVKAWLEKETYTPFNLAEGPLLRLRVANFKTTKTQVILLVVHHIITDLWSMVVLLDRLFALYVDLDSEFNTGPGYPSFAVYQQELVESQRGRRMIDFWQSNVNAATDTYFTLDKPRPARKSYKGAAVLFSLGKETRRILASISSSTGFTPNVILLSAFSTLVRVYTGSNLVQIGCPTAGRLRQEFEDEIGYFVNPIVFKADLAGNPTLLQLWKRVSEQLLKCMDNQAVPLSLVTEHLVESARTTDASQVFNTVFVLQQTHLDRPGLAKTFLGFDGVSLDLGKGMPKCRSITCPHRHSQFDLTLMMCLEADEICGAFHYDTDIFNHSTIERMSRQLSMIVEHVLSADFRLTRISEVKMIGDVERTLLMEAFNQRRPSFKPIGKLIHEIIHETAATYPERICFEVSGEEYDRLTYSDLDKHSNRLANFLRFAGARLESIVPVLLPRGKNLLIAWLAVLKSGAAILPLDPMQPEEYIAQIINQADPPIVIADSTWKAKPNLFSGKILDVETEWETSIVLASEEWSPLKVQTSKNLAYAIFTSGSTGKPKGVLLEHDAIVNYINWHIDYYDMTEDDRVFACAGLAFDASIADTWPTLAKGACILPIIDQDTSVVPHRFWDFVVQRRATMGFLTTQLCEMMLEEEAQNPRADLRHLRLLYTGGDRLHFGARPDACFRLVNIYGPTENTVNSTMMTVPRGIRFPPSIGYAAPNTQCFVLDPETLVLRPIGVVGELFVAGRQLARGYLDNDHLTERTFLTSSVISHLTGVERVYRTGDLVRWDETGKIEFIGRRDFQVKVRGHRIEISAIEAALRTHSGVKEAVVVAVEEVATHSKRLVAFVVPTGMTGTPSPKLLKTDLRMRLPSYMVPSTISLLKAMPLNSNHKVDRKKLESIARQEIAIPPLLKRKSSEANNQSKIERESISCQILSSVKSLFGETLGGGREEIDMNQDFFEIGGHSLSAARLVSKIRASFGVDLPLSKFLQNPTVQAVVNFVLAHGPSDNSERPCSGIRKRGGEDESMLSSETGNSSFRRHLIVSNSLVSSYRGGALSEWVARTKDGKDSDTAKPPSSKGGSGSLLSTSQASSALRRIRGRNLRETGSEGTEVSVSPLGMAHAPIWSGDLQRQQDLRKKHLERSMSTSLEIALEEEPVVSVLSYNQQSLWFMHKMDPQRVDFVVHVCCTLHGDLDIAKLKIALRALVTRHASLRTKYGEENGIPYQVVHTHVAELDFEMDFDVKTDHDLKSKLHEELHRPWDLSGSFPFRVRLFQMKNDGQFTILLTGHHIAVDGWSLDILLNDLGLFYDRACDDANLEDVPPDNELSIVEYARVQKEEISSSTGSRLWSFWQRQLAGHSGPIDLPSERGRIKAQTSGDWVHFEISSLHLAKMEMLMKLERATLFMSMLAIYSSLLFRYSGNEDIVIGTPMACRTVPELDSCVGNITNIVLLRMNVSKEDDFRSLLRQARAVVLSAFEHQEFPFSVLVERTSSFRDRERAPLFNVLLSLNQSFSATSSRAEKPGNNVTASLAALEVGESVPLGKRLRAEMRQDILQMSSPYDLSLIVSKGNSSDKPLKASFQYKSSLLSVQTVERMSAHFLKLVERSAVQPEMLYCEMPMLTKEEEDTILVDWNNTQCNFDAEKCIHELFETQAASSPLRPAIASHCAQWTYEELNLRANVLGRYLRYICKVQPGANVGILVQRSPNTVLAMLAVSKSGGCYVALDALWPVQRLSYVFFDSEMDVLLCDTQSLQVLQQLEAEEHHRLPLVVPFDLRWERIQRQIEHIFGVEHMQENLPPPASSSWGRNERQWQGSRSVVYMIYTSGSSGKPKGVLVEHRSLVNLVQWHIREYQITPKDRSSQVVGAAFDPVGLEVWPFLASGASIHFTDEETRKDVPKLRRWLRSQSISVCLLPTPLLELFLRMKFSHGAELSPRLRVLYGGGDKLHVPRSVLKNCSFRLDNHYGPSEGTIMCTYFNVNSLKWRESFEDEIFAPPIGRPLSNFACFVLDEQLQSVPLLVAGELCIAGPGLARGYFRKPNLTRASFIEFPPALKETCRGLSFLADSFLYRTGDRVRLLPDGNLEFIGRVDFQVKIRGMRVELGEIESVLKQHANVLEACVMMREDSPGQQRIVAYVVKTDEADHVRRIHELQSLIKESLPKHMVPDAWVFLHALPMTPNGKVDRRALPKPREDHAGLHGAAMEAVVLPSTVQEEVVAKLWKEVLALPSISVYDNFFDLGGHSLAATQLLSMLSDEMGVEISVTEFFANPTVSGMSSLVEMRQNLTESEAAMDSGTSDPLRNSALQILGFDPLAECELEPSLHPLPGAKWDNEIVWNWNTVFLTGTTGFLGAFVLEAILRRFSANDQPIFTAICLVRAPNNHEATLRVREALLEYRLFTTEDMPKMNSFSEFQFESPTSAAKAAQRSGFQVLVVCGDLELPYFGMHREDFFRLASKIDIIIHAAAYVHSLFPYSKLKKANVIGTQEVLRLAFARDDRLTPVGYISTLSVYASSAGGTVEFAADGPLTKPEDLHLLEGYAQTKWVAEQLVREAMKRGLPAFIFRPGRITGNSESGRGSFDDFMCIFLKGCIQLELAPNLNWVVDMNPADYVAETIVDLVSLHSANKVFGHAFNMFHPAPLQLSEYFRWIEDFGFRCPVVEYENWRDELQQAMKGESRLASRISTPPFETRTETEDDAADTYADNEENDGEILEILSIKRGRSIPISQSSRSASRGSISAFEDAGGDATTKSDEDNAGADSITPISKEDPRVDMPKRNALYALLTMFHSRKKMMESSTRLKFERSPLVRSNYPSLDMLNRIYLERMIRDGFLPPPQRQKADDGFFDLE